MNKTGYLGRGKTKKEIEETCNCKQPISDLRISGKFCILCFKGINRR